MIWLCVFPTLTALNVTRADWLAPMSPVVRTFDLATIAVPVVIYGLMHTCTADAPASCHAGNRDVGCGGLRAVAGGLDSSMSQRRGLKRGPK
jgi:hypothetical protein